MPVLFGLFSFLWPCLRAPGGEVPGFLAGLVLLAVFYFTILAQVVTVSFAQWASSQFKRPCTGVFRFARMDISTDRVIMTDGQ